VGLWGRLRTTIYARRSDSGSIFGFNGFPPKMSNCSPDWRFCSYRLPARSHPAFTGTALRCACGRPAVRLQQQRNSGLFCS
jgi:hypothetical protein